MNLGYTVKSLRKKKGISQKRMSELIGMSATSISQIENNAANPTFKNIRKMSDVLNIPIPIIYFLALEQDDIPIDKRDAFGYFNKPILKLIEEFFLNN